jgi:hypothetical protein
MKTVEQPLVSVVMVTCNVESYLAEAIGSVLSQTFRDFEFIIVDFGSTDKSKEIVASFAAKDNRIKCNEIPLCSYIEAKIAACALPTGKYIAIQDADDVSLPHRLKAEVAFLEKHPEVGLLGGAVQWIDSLGNPLITANEHTTEDQEIRAALKERNPFCHPSVLIRRDSFERAGGYRMAFKQSDDYDLWLRISEHYQCANLKQVVLNYRIHPQQLSIRKRKDQILCALAAQASAKLRGAGKPDPLNSVPEITPAILAGMGVSEAIQKNSLAKGYCFWINQMSAAGEHAAVLDSAREMLQLCEGDGVEPRYISDVYVLAAKAYWKQRKAIPTLLSVSRAVFARPRVLARPFKPFLRLFGAA